MQYRSVDGQWVVDVITLTATGTNRDGAWLRIKRWGCHIADVRTIDELCDYVESWRDLEQTLPA
jgi:hypothetical protein